MLNRIKLIFVGIILIFVILLAILSIYKVDPAEQGVELTWGKVTDVTSQGIHFVWPIIQDVEIINTQKINRETFGFTDNDEERDIRLESYRVTKDGKIVNIFYVVQYKIAKPIDWVMNPPKKKDDRYRVIRDIMESNVSSVANEMTVDDIWTTGKEQLQNTAKMRMQNAFDKVKFESWKIYLATFGLLQ